MKAAAVAGVVLLALTAGRQLPAQRAPGTRSLAEFSHLSSDERIRAYERMLQSSPENVQVQSGLISAYLEKLRESSDYAYLDRASKLVDKMLERDGGSLSALRFENEIDLQRHNFRAVAERARDMSNYAPSDPGVWGNLGDAAMELGDYEQASKAYLRMFSLRPNLASYNRLAYLEFVTGDAASGMASMRNAIDAGDTQPAVVAWCWAELGDMYFKTGKLNEAAAAYRTAIQLFPGLHRASAGLGKVEAAAGRLDAAIHDYERAQSIVPMVEYASALEDLYAAANMSRKAQEQADLIATIEKLGAATNEKTNRNLALALADHDWDVKAALTLVEAESQVRGDVYTWDAIGWVLYKNHRITEAKEASDKAIRLRTPEPLFYYHASKIAQALGDEAAAMGYSRDLLALNAKFDISKNDLGEARAR
jgi:tetratricopeptide (TPR) repeat protein